MRLLGVLALLGLVAMHGTTSARVGHETMTAGHGTMTVPAAAPSGATTPTALATAQRVASARPSSGHDDGAGVQAPGCPMDRHGESATMDCASAVATPPGSTPLAVPAGSYLLLPAALPRWPSPRAATVAPPAAAPSHVILRT